MITASFPANDLCVHDLAYLIGLIFLWFAIIMVKRLFPDLSGADISPGISIQPSLNLPCHRIFLHELFPVFNDLLLHFFWKFQKAAFVLAGIEDDHCFRPKLVEVCPRFFFIIKKMFFRLCGGVSLEDGEDRYVAGQAVPKTILGSNISFRYKRFDLSLQVNGAFGHKIYNGTSLTYMNMNIFPDYNVMKKAPKQNIKDQTATDYWLEKGDYVNFDYVTLGWNVPIEKVQKLKKYVRSLRLAFTVNNLATISGYSGLSPMINSSTVNSTLGVDDKRGYPLARTYTLGLSINF